MVKKIRFPLEMDNGIEVRGMEELRDNFSLTRIVHYFENGKLLTWLKDRYEDELASKVEILDRSDKEFAKKISNIFGVPYNESEEDALEEELVRAKRLELLKKYTDDTSFMEKVNQIAFEQDELYDLLDENITTIYLCGEKFSIPLSKKGVKYIGINSPIIVVDSLECINWEEKGIELEGIRFNEKYQAIVNEYRKNSEIEGGYEQDEEEGKITSNIDAGKLTILYDKVNGQTNCFFGNDAHIFRSKFMKSPIISKREAEKIVKDAIEEDIEFLHKVFSGPNSSMFERTKKEYFNQLVELCNLYTEIFGDEKIDFSIIKEEFEQNYYESYRECRMLFDDINWHDMIDYSIESMGGGGFFSTTSYSINSESEIPQYFLSLTSRCGHIISDNFNRFKKNLFLKKIESELNS